MPQTPTEDFLKIKENGFEICGIFQETPYLKKFGDDKGKRLSDFLKEGTVRGFREKMMNKSPARPFLYDGKLIPGISKMFFGIMDPVVKDVEYSILNYHTETPIEDELSVIESIINGCKGNEFLIFQARYIITGLKLLKKILFYDQKESDDLLFDSWSNLAEFYFIEGLIIGIGHDWEKPPGSGLCPICLSPMKIPKDNRSSRICEKCRHDIEIEKRREQRGNPGVGERLCACGCGETITGRPNKKYANDTHGRRMQKR